MAQIYSGHIENVEYGENITAPAYAYINPADGKMYKASASTTAHPANGLVFASGSMGDIGQILFTGVIEWDFLTPISAASVYYLSNTAGAQTTTAPTNVQHLAYAVSSTRLYVNPQPFATSGGGGGGGGGVESVTGPGVDNSDAANPVVSARPYKVYSALLSQSGTDAPTATVLENTFGVTPTWSYNGSGDYILTSSGAFPTASTWIYIIGRGMVSGDFPDSFAAYLLDTSNIRVWSGSNGSFDPPVDGVLFNTPFEIRVY